MRQPHGNEMSEVIGDSRNPTLRTPPTAPVDRAFASPLNALQDDIDDSAGWKCTDTVCVASPLPVVVSGQLCMVGTSKVNSLFSLDAAVRKTLKIDTPSLSFFDINNRQLQTDAMLQNALTEGLLPLCGKTSDDGNDTSVQSEDITRMQWKTIQAQMAAIMTKVAANTRKLGDGEDHLEKSAKYLQGGIERVRSECLTVYCQHQEAVQAEIKRFSERLDGMSALVNGERQVRESGIQQLTSQFQEMNDLLNDEAGTRRQQATGHLALLNELRSQVDDNKQEIASAEKRQSACTARLQERVEDMANQSAKQFDEHIAALKNDPAISWNLDCLTRQLQLMRGEAETSAGEMTSRVWDLEQQSAGLEKRLADSMNSHSSNFELVSERQDRVFQAMEQLRLEQKQIHTQVQDSLVRMGDLGVSVGAEVRELVQQERKLRDEQIRRVRQGMSDQQTRLNTDLEQKLIEKFELKFMQRESVVHEIVTEAANVLNTTSGTPRMNTTSGTPRMPGLMTTLSPRGSPCQSPPTTDFSVRYRTPDARHRSSAITRQLSPSQGSQLRSSSAVSVGGEYSVERMMTPSSSSITEVGQCLSDVPQPVAASVRPMGGSFTVQSPRRASLSRQTTASGASLGLHGALGSPCHSFVEWQVTPCHSYVASPSSARNAAAPRTASVGSILPQRGRAIPSMTPVVPSAAGSLNSGAGSSQSFRPATIHAPAVSQKSGAAPPSAMIQRGSPTRST